MLMPVDTRRDLWLDPLTVKLFRGDPGEETGEISPVTPDELAAYDVAESWLPTIVFLSALRCNLRCSYCFADEGTYQATSAKQMTLESYVDGYQRVKKLYGGVAALSFFGGEPLLNYAEIKKFLGWLRDHDESPRLAVNTNATILNDEILTTLVEHGVAVGTSVDGPAFLHDANRVNKAGRGTYAKLAQNVRRMKEAGLTVMAQFTLTKAHVDAYEPGAVSAWLEELDALGLDNYDLIPVSTGDPRHRIPLEGPGGARFQALLDELCDHYFGKIARCDVAGVSRMVAGHLLKVMTGQRQRDCTAGLSVTITPEGMVFPCHAFADKERFGVPVRTLPITPLANPEFRRAAEAKRIEVPACQACLSRSVCSAWCKGLTLESKGRLDDVLDERCVMINTLTRRSARFIADDLPRNRAAIMAALLEYNARQLELSGTGDAH